MVLLALTMALTKFRRVSYINAYIKSFEKTFWSGISLDEFYESNKANLSHPLGMIFKAVYEEWKNNDKLKNHIGSKADIKERMLNIAHVQKVSILQTCDRYLDFLALFIHSAPFLGLLGTVFGLIEIFYSIDIANGISASTSIASIGSSLIVVVASIFVVLLSMLIHWYFNLKLRDTSDKIDSFIVDLLHIFGRSLDETATQGTNVDNGMSGASQVFQPMQEMNDSNDNNNTQRPPKQTRSSADDDI